MSTCAVDTSWKEVSTYCNNLEQGVLRATGALLEGVAIFGAGPYGETAYRYLKKIGANIVCFVDNDLHKQGTLLEGIQVVSPREFSGLAAKVVFIAARHAVLPVRRQLEEMEILGVSFDAFFCCKQH